MPHLWHDSVDLLGDFESPRAVAEQLVQAPLPTWAKVSRRLLRRLLRMRPLQPASNRLGFYNVEAQEAERILLSTQSEDYESRLEVSRIASGIRIENVAWAHTLRGACYLLAIWPTRGLIFRAAVKRVG